MRLSTIAACLLLVTSSPALACIEHAAEQTGWLHEAPSAYRYFAAESAEEATMLGVSLFGAGLASLALVVMAFRILRRAPAGGRARPIEFEPATPEESTLPFGRPVEPWIRIDEGHERPELTRVGRDEEAFSHVLEVV